MGRAVAPWAIPLTDLERSLVSYVLVVAGLALLAMLVRTWTVRGEVRGRYRPAVAASLGVLSVAFLSYVVLVVKFDIGYTRVGSMWVPDDGAVWVWSARYMDRTVTVPLLVVELVAVSSLAARALSRARAAGVVAAVAMIAAGYLGGVEIDGGRDRTALLVCGLVSAVFFAVLSAIVLFTVLRSLPALPSVAHGAGAALRGRRGREGRLRAADPEGRQAAHGVRRADRAGHASGDALDERRATLRRAVPGGR